MYNDYFKEELEEARKIGEKIGEEIGKEIGGQAKEKELVEKMRQNGIDKDIIEKIIN